MSTVFCLHPKSPYNFNWSAQFFGRFKNDVVDMWISPTSSNLVGTYYRAFEVKGDLCLVRVTPDGTIDEPRLKIEVLKGRSVQEIKDVIVRILRISDDLTEFYRKAQADTVMSNIIKRFYGLKPTRTPTVFEMFIIAISEQQISLAAAVTLRSRLARRFGKRIEYHGKSCYSFPGAESLADASAYELHELGFTRRKAETMVNIARIQASGRFDFEELCNMPSEEATKLLSQIPGFGPWSIEYILARGLGHVDVYPKSDLAVIRAFGHFYGNGITLNSSETEKILSQWHPFERYAEYYVLVAYEMQSSGANF